MPKDPKKFLYDIAESIDFIFNIHLEEINSLAEYEASRTIQDAVERRLITIGEAVHKLQKQGIQLAYGDQVINRRNTLTHRYDSFTTESIWESVQRELPKLKVDVDRLLKE